jgi:dTDP-4-amino-4,6-dideoxygalactose transaminase
MDRIMEISRETGVPIVEDCSHCHGAEYKGRPIGTLGHVACWSLQGTKPVSGGEGGVLATNHTDLFERACLVGQVNRIVGMDLATPHYEELQPLGTGMKFRAHPLGIGIAKVQLRKLPELNRKRRAYIEEVEAGLKDIPCVSPVSTYEGSVRGGFYGFPIRYRSDELGGAPLSAFVESLKAHGLNAGASPYPLLHSLPYFAKGFDLFKGGRGVLCEGWEGYRDGDFPVTEKMLKELVFLPVLSDPVEGAAQAVLGVIRQAAERLAKGRA